MSQPVDMGSAANSDSRDKTPLPLTTLSTPEHVFPTPSLNWVGKHANEHSNFQDSSKQVPSPYNLARRLPDGKLSEEIVYTLAKVNYSSKKVENPYQQQNKKEAVAGDDRVKRSPRGGFYSGLSKSHISPEEEKASLEFYEGASFLKVSIPKPKLLMEPPKRGKIKELSEAARRRMMDCMAKINHDQIPFFITLTYPDTFPIYSKEYKRHLDVLGKRILKKWPVI